MTLRDLSHALSLSPPRDPRLDNLTLDSITIFPSEATEHTIFLGEDGYRHTAVEYISLACKKGVRVVIAKRDEDIPSDMYKIVVKDARKCALMLAKMLYPNSFFGLKYIFITGTKGKTTTAHILAHLLNNSSCPTATVGTLGVRYGDYHAELKNTTPDIFLLLPHLEKVYALGARLCIIEVSSQALKDFRIDGLSGEYGIFTGISTDHIDPLEHKNFAEYREAKRRLFCDFGIQKSFSPRLSPLAPFMTRGIKEEFFVDTKAPCDLTLKILKMSKSGITFSDGKTRGFLSLCGEFNLENAALATLCASHITSFEPSYFYPFLSSVRVDGRTEQYTCLGRQVFIDYAHNAESIMAIAKLARTLTSSRLIGVVGAVGGRARGRRPSLSLACEKSFDLTILTEDDSTGECAEDITCELYSYFQDKNKARMVPRRKEAILEAFRLSKRGECILLLGKGHERTLMHEGESIPFDERAILSEIEEGKYGKM